MPAITLAQAEAQLDLWLAASTAIASGQSYRIGDRQLTRTDAAEVRNMLIFWESKVNTLTASAGTSSGPRARLITPIT